MLYDLPVRGPMIRPGLPRNPMIRPGMARIRPQIALDDHLVRPGLVYQAKNYGARAGGLTYTALPTIVSGKRSHAYVGGSWNFGAGLWQPESGILIDVVIKFAPLGASTFYWIISTCLSLGADSGILLYVLEDPIGTYKLRFAINHYDLISLSFNLTSNTYYHVLCYYSVVLGELRLFINGVDMASRSYSTPITNTDSVKIGCLGGGYYVYRGEIAVRALCDLIPGYGISEYSALAQASFVDAQQFFPMQKIVV